MPECPNCGSRQLESGVFCDNCGIRLASDMPSVPAAPVQLPVRPVESRDALATQELRSPSAPGADAGALICAVCGQVLISGAAFCHTCGSPTGTTPTNLPPAPDDDLVLWSDDVSARAVQDARAQRPEGAPAQPVDGARARLPDEIPGNPSPSSDLAPTIAMSAPAPMPARTIPHPSPATPTGIPGGLAIHKTKIKILFPEDKSELILGRADPFGSFEPDIDLEVYGGAQKGVSRRHARIFAENDQVYIEDLGSSNGTYINRRQLQARQAYRIYDRDRIWLGHMQLHLFLSRSNH